MEIRTIFIWNVIFILRCMIQKINILSTLYILVIREVDKFLINIKFALNLRKLSPATWLWFNDPKLNVSYIWLWNTVSTLRQNSLVNLLVNHGIRLTIRTCFWVMLVAESQHHDDLHLSVSAGALTHTNTPSHDVTSGSVPEAKVWIYVFNSNALDDNQNSASHILRLRLTRCTVSFQIVTWIYKWDFLYLLRNETST